MLGWQFHCRFRIVLTVTCSYFSIHIDISVRMQCVHICLHIGEIIPYFKVMLLQSQFIELFSSIVLTT